MLFKEKFKSNSKIFLDGGNGSEIANLGGEMTPAFSALATITAPEIVRQVHENFMDAGCDLITANTFSTTRHNMNSINRGDETKEFIVRSVEIAKKAIKNKRKENIVGIAGSMSNFFSLKENEFGHQLVFHIHQRIHPLRMSPLPYVFLYQTYVSLDKT